MLAMGLRTLAFGVILVHIILHHENFPVGMQVSCYKSKLYLEDDKVQRFLFSIVFRLCGLFG